MTWIAIRKDLHYDPAVIYLAKVFQTTEDDIVGKLARIWSWADSHLADGNAPSVTKAFLDRYIGVTGFADVMCAVGWLDVKDGGLTFPNWGRYMSKCAKKRLQTQRRVENHRENSDTPVEVCNAPSVTKALPQNSTEQKSTEQNNNRTEQHSATNNVRRLRDDVVFSAPPLQTTQTSQTATPTHFDAFWDACPRVRRRDKGGAKKAYDAAVKRLAGVCADPHTFLLARMTAYAASPLGQGQYSKMPSSWLIKCSYDDDDSQWQALDRPLTTAEHNSNFFDDLKQEIINGHDAGKDSGQTELPFHGIQRQGDA